MLKFDIHFSEIDLAEDQLIPILKLYLIFLSPDSKAELSVLKPKKGGEELS